MLLMSRTSGYPIDVHTFYDHNLYSGHIFLHVYIPLVMSFIWKNNAGRLGFFFCYNNSFFQLNFFFFSFFLLLWSVDRRACEQDGASTITPEHWVGFQVCSLLFLKCSWYNPTAPYLLTHSSIPHSAGSNGHYSCLDTVNLPEALQFHGSFFTVSFDCSSN